MAQDPDRYQNQGDPEVALNTHALDMVTLPGGRVSTESEADMIRGVMDANGIPSLLVEAPQLPNFGFEIRVPRGLVKQAEDALTAALAAGPDAAAEAEAETEPRP
jgi:hypothetical protein